LIIYWDMDGVLTDLYGTLATHHGVGRDFLHADDDRCHELYTDWAHSRGGLDVSFTEIAANQLSDMRRLMQDLHLRGHRQEILTSYGVYDALEMGALIHMGKRLWLLEHYRDYFEQGVLSGFNGVAHSRLKALFAGPRTVLIDDSPENVKSFCQAGGEGVLYSLADHGALVPELSRLQLL